MEYLIVKGDDDVVGGFEVSKDGTVKFNLPFRLSLVQGIAFGKSNDWTCEKLAKRINNHGRHLAPSNWKDVDVVPANVPAGCFFPRIARPTTSHPKDPPSAQGLGPSDVVEMHQSIGQLKSLVALLEDIVSVVEPDVRNLGAYGPKIRNLLILASTEFEAAAKAVLRENGFEKKRTSIQDYEKTQKAMLLSQYRISFDYFPNLEPVRPFEEWDQSEHLSWYGAYNNSKHDRHTHQTDANLKNAILALAGCFSFLVASYGWRNVYKFGDSIGMGLRVDEFPSWSLGDLYRRAKSRRRGAGPFDAQDIDVPVNFPFGDPKP